jgi:S-DNA-T family DNA segregation ATPase FtsK/SpoIIIE
MAKPKNDNPARKHEILGLMLMTAMVLILLSILSYSANDFAIITDSAARDLLNPANGAAARIQNFLGFVGAYIAYFFVYILFGYFSAALPLLGFRYGWSLFRHQSLKELGWYTGYGIGLMILLATFTGWFGQTLEADIYNFSGMVGYAIANVMMNLTGSIGSFIILFVMMGVMALLVVDRDIQATVDRVRDWFAALRDKVRETRDKRRDKASRDKVEETRDKEEGPKPLIVVHKPAKAEAAANSASVIGTASRADTITSTLPPVRADHDLPIDVPAAVPKDLHPDLEPEPEPIDNDDDLDIAVYKGEEEEQAGARDLEKEQRMQNMPLIQYRFPTIDLLDTPPLEGNDVDMSEIKHNKEIILDKLGRHGIEIVGIEAIVGPTVTLYELQPAPDVKISKIESYANDLKMAMAAHGIRIIAPIPGKSAVGIEVPNRKRETVYIKQLINTKKFVETKFHLPVAFGKTIENEVFMVDLTQLPHLLIAGATGSGKSVGINTIITCLLYKCHPENLKFVLIDPKKIELSLYRQLQRHFLATLPDADEPIITDTSKVMETLTSVCKEMDTRYDLLKMAMVRDVRAYNDKFKTGVLDVELGHRHLPYIVVVIDELADLMLTAGKAIEEPIARIAQLARAVGIHAVVATQRPSVNVITGTIKANFPVRIAYQVASKIDSRTILDTSGADQLVGRGDMLVSSGGRMVRVQNAFVSTEEVEKINAFIGNQLGYNAPYYLPKIEDPDANETTQYDASDRDDLFEEAAKVVVLHQQGSVSLIQRKLKLGYNRAGRLIDQLYAAGIVGPYQGSTAREVLIPDEESLYEHLRTLDEP